MYISYMLIITHTQRFEVSNVSYLLRNQSILSIPAENIGKPENLWFSDVFRGCNIIARESSDKKWVNK